MKNSHQQGLIEIRLLIVMVAGLIVIGGSGAAYAYEEHRAISNKVAQAARLSDVGSHSDAIELLELAQQSWLVDSLGVKKAEIKNELEEAELRKQHQAIYLKSLGKLEATDWNDAITLLREIPGNSFYHDKALHKIEESNRRIVEEELDAERAARQIAEQVAAQQEEARKVAEQEAQQEEQARKEAERVAAREVEARRVAERVAAREEKLRKLAERNAAREEASRRVAEQKAREETIKGAREVAARKEAEQRAAQERLARERQQREAEAQRTLAGQQGRAWILELARTHPLIKAVISGELKFYIEPLPSYAGVGVSNAVDAIGRDLSSWRPYGASVRRVYDGNDADLTISWIRDYGSHTLGQSIVRVHIKVGLGRNNCVGDWSAFDANTVKKVLWHELGHSMGYGHSSNPNNVMYYQTTTRFVVEQVVSELIPGGWYYTLPLCQAGAYSYTFESDNSSTGFNLLVIPVGVDPKKFSSGDGKFYAGCGKESVYRFSGVCNVASGARVYVTNLSRSNAIRFNGKIVRTTTPPWPDMDWDQTEFQYDSATLMRYRALFQ